MRRPFSVSLTSTSNSSPAITIYLLTFFTILTTALSTSISIPHNDNDMVTRASKPFLLRVMPLGASITVGYQSSDGNGYRKYLREQLRYAGWEVDMVGSLENGTMKDNQNEGHFGDTIDHIAEAGLGTAKSTQPNVILINAGTNDGLQNIHITGAGSRIDDLISELLTSIPNTTIILSTLIPNKKVQRVVERLSTEYRNVAARRRANGDRVVLAEMAYFIGQDQLVDNTHPDDEGYKEMAAVWWAAIQEAEDEGFLEKPNGVTANVLADLAGRNGTVQSEGKGLDDGPVEDPGLPGYVAPAQPSEEGASVRLDVGMGWIVGGLIAGFSVL